MEKNDKIKHVRKDIRGVYLGTAIYYSKQSIPLEVVERFIRTMSERDSWKLDLITELRRFQELNQNQQVAVLLLENRTAPVCMDIEKFMADYRKDEE